MALVAAYSFDTGAVVDDSGRGHPGTGFNTPTFPAGHTNGGINFASASSEYVEIADHADFTLGSAWTVMCWARFTTLNGGELVCKQNQWWLAEAGDGKLYHGFYYSGGGNAFSLASVSTVTTATWYHVAGRYDGTNYSIVLNGVQDASAGDPGRTMADSGNPVRLGSWDGAIEFLNGDLDDVRIYNEYLSDSQIATLRDTPVTSGSVTYTPAGPITSPSRW